MTKRKIWRPKNKKDYKFFNFMLAQYKINKKIWPKIYLIVIYNDSNMVEIYDKNLRAISQNEK